MRLNIRQRAEDRSQQGLAFDEGDVYSVDKEDVDDLVEVLTSTQADLVVGMCQASEQTSEILRSHLPQGTRELLYSHNAIDETGRLTPLGVSVGHELAYQAGRGPEPRLLEVAYATVAAAPKTDAVYAFNEQEKEIVELALETADTGKIASTLGLSRRTVNKQLRRLDDRMRGQAATAAGEGMAEPGAAP